MKQMKNFKLCLAAASMLAALTASLSSCSVDNDYSVLPNPNAVVTIKTTDSGASYFQVDGKTTFEPVNWNNPYGREVRALLRYSEEPGDAGEFSKRVKVEWIDSVRTKSAVLYDEEFGTKKTTALSIYNDWITCCEDGYLTLHFAAWFGSGRNTPHTIELAVNPETLDLYLRHDDNGDSTGPMVPGEGVIAFRLDELLKDAKDGDKLTLHWKDYGDIDGVEKTAELKYLSRFSLSER